MKAKDLLFQHFKHHCNFLSPLGLNCTAKLGTINQRQMVFGAPVA